MTNHLIKKFPDRVDQIQSLLRTDASFEEACADYEKVCIWLSGHCQAASRPPEECDQALDLMKELEGEINEKLNEAEF